MGIVEKSTPGRGAAWAKASDRSVPEEAEKWPGGQAGRGAGVGGAGRWCGEPES